MIHTGSEHYMPKAEKSKEATQTRRKRARERKRENCI